MREITRSQDEKRQNLNYEVEISNILEPKTVIKLKHYEQYFGSARRAK